MVEVTIYRTKSHEYTGFDVKGHAGLAESGKDVLCAAISMLVINTINAIGRYTTDKTSCVDDDEQGMIEYRFSHVAGHDAHLLMRTMILGLASLEDNSDYEPFIDITFKEV